MDCLVWGGFVWFLLALSFDLVFFYYVFPIVMN